MVGEDPKAAFFPQCWYRKWLDGFLIGFSLLGIFCFEPSIKVLGRSGRYYFFPFKPATKCLVRVKLSG